MQWPRDKALWRKRTAPPPNSEMPRIPVWRPWCCSPVTLPDDSGLCAGPLVATCLVSISVLSHTPFFCGSP